MKKIVTTMTRIMGEARLSLLTRPDQTVSDAFFSTTVPIRAFESFAVGKNPYFVVEGVKRICGICHAVQGITAALAFEDALGVSVPPDAALHRELCAVINRLQSHALAQMVLSDDIFVPETAAAVKRQLFRLYNTLCDAMEAVGGSAIHPPYITLGGMAKGLTEKALAKLNPLLGNVEELLGGYQASLAEPDKMKEGFLRLKSIKKKPPRLFATGVFAGDKKAVELKLIEVVPDIPTEHAFAAEAQRSTGMAALYAKQPVEVGPRARMTLFNGLTEEGLTGLNTARVQEMRLSFERARELLRTISPAESAVAPKLTLKAGEGVGVYEAPRGVLIHAVKLGGNGRVQSHRIILPTMFNVLMIQEAVKGLPAALSETIVRLYDPCIPCEVH